MSLLNDIKNDVKKAGANKNKIVYFREGQKVRLRFLDDMDEGRKYTFHDSFQKGVNVPCQEIFGKDCKYCEDEELRTRELYCWSVFDYEANEVKILLQPVNNCSPIPAIVAMYETYGTLTDRDYVVTANGKQQNKTFSVVPMDKNKFRNAKAKPLSESKILDIIAKAFPVDDDDEEEEEDIRRSKRRKETSSKSRRKARDEEEEEEIEEEEFEDDEEEDEDEIDYSDMTPQELFKLCKERDIECEKRKSAKYYINLLKEADKADDDWGDSDDDEDDEW